MESASPLHDTASPEGYLLDHDADLGRLAALQAALVVVPETPADGRG